MEKNRVKFNLIMGLTLFSFWLIVGVASHIHRTYLIPKLHVLLGILGVLCVITFIARQLAINKGYKPGQTKLF